MPLSAFLITNGEDACRYRGGDTDPSSHKGKIAGVEQSIDRLASEDAGASFYLPILILPLKDTDVEGNWTGTCSHFTRINDLQHCPTSVAHAYADAFAECYISQK